MMITITTSGGIGGFGLAKSAEVATEDLAETLRLEACARLDPGALGALAAARPRAGAADGVVYHIRVAREGAAPVAFDLSEAALPPQTLDLIDQLLARGRRR